MSSKKTHKFDKKLDITYGQYIKDSMSGEVDLQRELERVLGKEKTHSILREWAEKRTVKLVKDHLKDSGVEIKNFEDFKNYMKKMWTSEHTLQTHTCEITHSSSDRVTYKVTECIWAKMMRELLAADLGLLTMCDIDFVSASA